MDRRWNLLLIIPLATALIAFFVSGQLIYTGLGFVVGYLVVLGLRHLLLPPHLHKAVRRFQEGDLDEALVLTRRSIEARPERWESHYLQSLVHFALSNLSAAESSAHRAVELNPESSTNYVTLGQTLYAQARFEEAEDAFAKAVTLRGREGLNQYHLGATLFQLDRCDEAIPRLELATRLGINNPQLELLAYYYLGRCLQKEGEEEAAEAAYAAMQQRGDVLEALKYDLGRAANYPALPKLQKDVAAIEKRLRPVP